MQRLTFSQSFCFLGTDDYSALPNSTVAMAITGTTTATKWLQHTYMSYTDKNSCVKTLVFTSQSRKCRSRGCNQQLNSLDLIFQLLLRIKY